MKNVIVRNVYVVGMHHWGGRPLAVGPLHFCGQEPSNPKDPNAIAVFSDEDCSRKVGYVRRQDAAALTALFKYRTGHVYLRAKMAPEKPNRFKGPMQNCSIGFKCKEEDVESVRSHLTRYTTRIF